MRKGLSAAVGRSAALRKGAQVLDHLRAERRKPLGQLLYELLEFGVRKREIPKYYFATMMYRESVQHPRDYLSYKEIARIERLANNVERAPFLKNKVLFHHHFRALGMPLPRYLGYSLGEHFFFPHGNRPIESPAGLRGVIEDMFALSGAASIFMKRIGGTSGKGARRIDADSLNPSHLTTLFETIRHASYLFEQTIVQHPALSAIYPHSVNTLRLATCIGQGGQIGCVYGLMRFGANGAQVDNASSGGVYNTIDLATGMISPMARRLPGFGGAEYARHPDTGFQFAGFTIPHFQAALEMAKAAATLLSYRLVGWDIAITEEGPVLVEGNNKPDITSMDIALDGCKRHPVFASFLKDLATA